MHCFYIKYNSISQQGIYIQRIYRRSYITILDDVSNAIKKLWEKGLSLYKHFKLLVSIENVTKKQFLKHTV